MKTLAGLQLFVTSMKRDITYLFKVVNVALENLHTSFLGSKWSNIPNTHYTETQIDFKNRIHPYSQPRL